MTLIMIITGIISILLYFFDILTFRIELLIRDIIRITIGFILLVMLLRSELIKYNWKNGTTLFNFFFLLFSVAVISQIIKIIFEPNLMNLFFIIIIIFLAGVLFNTLKNLSGTYLLQHYKSPKVIIEKVEDLLKTKKIKYEKKGPKSPSTKNLFGFIDRILIKKWDISLNISSKGIIIGKINSSNRLKIDQLMKSINNEIEKI